MSLPLPKLDQTYCDVSALEAGIIHLELITLITGDHEPGAVSVAPLLSFLLQHSKTKDKFVFDLGIRKDWENYAPEAVEWARDTSYLDIPQDVVESLAKGGASPSDISTVCLSHLHFDHVGNTSLFTTSNFIVGGEGEDLLKTGYPGNLNSYHPQTGHLWGFPRALDFYGDGSLYIIDSPGHLSGHINLLVRTSADGAWIFLAGDSAHHWDLITWKADIPVPAHPDLCAHQDKELAEEHIRRIRKLLNIPRVRVILAHDEPWFVANRGGSAFWPGKIRSL